jgi:serine/threonine-protein kinase
MHRLGRVLVETYRLERRMAEGGMATVYEAQHVRVPKRFAVKFLKIQLAGNNEALTRFKREADLVASFDHPNIVQLVDYNTDEGVPYMVLEYLDGMTLAKRLDRGRFGLQQTLKITAAIASAIASAHDRDVVHRDLKPENIILVRDTVKLLDFGVAKLRSPGGELTAFNTILGTVAYMAPEQLSGQPVEPRTDQYSLAAIVVEMLTGHGLVDTKKPIAEQAMKILHGAPPQLGDVPPALNEVLQRALAKSPADRYPTIGEFQEALAAAAHATMFTQLPVAPQQQPAVTPSALVSLADDLPPLQPETTDVTELPAEKTAFSAAPPISDQTDIAAESAAGEPARRTTDPDMPVAQPEPLSPGDSTAQGYEPATPQPAGPTKLMPTVAPPEDAPRITAKNMQAVAPPPEWTGLSNVPSLRPSMRWLWVMLGAAAGLGVASLVWAIITR